MQACTSPNLCSPLKRVEPNRYKYTALPMPFSTSQEPLLHVFASIGVSVIPNGAQANANGIRSCPTGNGNGNGEAKGLCSRAKSNSA